MLAGNTGMEGNKAFEMADGTEVTSELKTCRIRYGTLTNN